MSNNSNLAIGAGAGIGAVAGGVAGYHKIGKSKAAQILKTLEPAAEKSYIDARVDANFGKIVDSYKGHNSRIIKYVQRTAEIAKENFNTSKSAKAIRKLANNTKIKWAAGVGAAGAIIGAAVAAGAVATTNKINEKKAEDENI